MPGTADPLMRSPAASINREPYVFQQVIKAPNVDYMVVFSAFHGILSEETLVCGRRNGGFRKGIRKPQVLIPKILHDCRTEPLRIETLRALVSKLRYHGCGNIAYRPNPQGDAIFFDFNTRIGGGGQAEVQLPFHVQWLRKYVGDPSQPIDGGTYGFVPCTDKAAEISVQVWADSR